MCVGRLSPVVVGIGGSFACLSIYMWCPMPACLDPPHSVTTLLVLPILATHKRKKIDYIYLYYISVQFNTIVLRF